MAAAAVAIAVVAVTSCRRNAPHAAKTFENGKSSTSVCSFVVLRFVGFSAEQQPVVFYQHHIQHVGNALAHTHIHTYIHIIFTIYHTVPARKAENVSKTRDRCSNRCMNMYKLVCVKVSMYVCMFLILRVKVTDSMQ